MDSSYNIYFCNVCHTGFIFEGTYSSFNMLDMSFVSHLNTHGCDCCQWETWADIRSEGAIVFSKDMKQTISSYFTQSSLFTNWHIIPYINHVYDHQFIPCQFYDENNNIIPISYILNMFKKVYENVYGKAKYNFDISELYDVELKSQFTFKQFIQLPYFNYIEGSNLKTIKPKINNRNLLHYLSFFDLYSSFDYDSCDFKTIDGFFVKLIDYIGKPSFKYMCRQKDFFGNLPLHIAAKNNNVSITYSLIKYFPKSILKYNSIKSRPLENCLMLDKHILPIPIVYPYYNWLYYYKLNVICLYLENSFQFYSSDSSFNMSLKHLCRNKIYNYFITENLKHPVADKFFKYGWSIQIYNIIDSLDIPDLTKHFLKSFTHDLYLRSDMDNVLFLQNTQKIDNVNSFCDVDFIYSLLFGYTFPLFDTNSLGLYITENRYDHFDNYLIESYEHIMQYSTHLNTYLNDILN